MTQADIHRGYEIWQGTNAPEAFEYLGQFDVIGAIKKLGSSSDSQDQYQCCRLFVLACDCYYRTARPELLEATLQEVVSLHWLDKKNPALHCLNVLEEELRTVLSEIDDPSKNQESLRRCLDLVSSLPSYDLPDRETLLKKLSSTPRP